MNNSVKLALCLFFGVCTGNRAGAQVTTGHISGIVSGPGGERMAGATVKIVHETMGIALFTRSNRAGLFYISDLHPGGPYTVEVSFLNYISGKKTGIQVGLGGTVQADFSLEPDPAWLQQVTVRATRRTQAGTLTYPATIDRDKIDALPSVGRNLNDYLSSLPAARIVAGNEGAISFGGQNNRYNAFYVDGAVSNDVYGLAATGTNGGQTGISPLSVEAIEQLQITASPYDASLGNFTGAGINAVTRSGTNKFQSSLYYYFSNNTLSGTNAYSGSSLKPIFFRRTYGFRTKGPLAVNRLFYFVSLELQREKDQSSLRLDEYRGNTGDPKLLRILANSVRSNYGYDAGGFLENQDQVFADRLVARFDWHPNHTHSLSISGRYMKADRISTNIHDAETIYFNHSGHTLLHNSLSAALEWKSRVGRQTAQRLLLTYAGVKDDRGPAGQPFPRVRIYDGNGSIVLGTDISATVNLLLQENWLLSNKWNFILGKHTLHIGLESEYSNIYNAFIQNAFGSYTYGTIHDFLTARPPSGYLLGFSMIDSLQGDRINASANIHQLRAAFFVTDEYRPSGNFVWQFGLRVDKQGFLTQPITDAYITDTAIPAFSRYHELHGAGSVKPLAIALAVSPRTGFTWKLPDPQIVIQGGIGIFSGRMPLAWHGGIYQYNGVFTGGYEATNTQLNRIRFRQDPFQPWHPRELNAAVNKEPLNLSPAILYLPSLVRASVVFEKKFSKSLIINFNMLISKNLKEIVYTNVNLIPPTEKLTGPDSRLVYTDSNQARIPVNPDGSNPFAYSILLGNRYAGTGYSCEFGFTIRKQTIDQWKLELNYHYGRSTTLHDGTSSVNLSQWRSVEHINGRNNFTRSVSDFSAGHRLSAWLSRKFMYARRKFSTTVSLSYNGQSGSPFSYVYGGVSMVRDDGKAGGWELIYVPTHAELAGMHFLPSTVGNIVFTPEQQKLALEEYLVQDRYLRNRRGQYAERNAARLPFSHIVDMKLEQHLSFKINKKIHHLVISFDLYNLGNLLNRNWGWRYQQPFDKLELLAFAGYAGNGPLLPQYRFDPYLLTHKSRFISQSSSPAYASFWTCQLGIRFTF